MYVQSSNNYIRSNAKVLWYMAKVAAAALVGVAAKCYERVNYGGIDSGSVQQCNIKFGGI